jgi:hypothetical protein
MLEDGVYIVICREREEMMTAASSENTYEKFKH